jgi:serine/threonine protein kinase
MPIAQSLRPLDRSERQSENERYEDGELSRGCRGRYMGKTLIILAGPDEGRVFPLESETFLIGRSRATGTALIDSHVSRVHCQVYVEDGKHVLADFESGSGTFVNGQRTAKHILQPGDLIRVGETSIQYTDIEPTSAAKADQPRRRAAQDLSGSKLGHYKLGALLARGRHGYVYHARDTRRNHPVVLKVLDGSFHHRPEPLRRFTEIMKAVMPLRHPHLLKVYGAGKSGDYCWIAKEYVPGESLAAVIGRADVAGKIDWRNVLKIGIYLARALDYAHGKTLIHQNVTPHNILLGKTPRETKLADLMVSLAIEDDPLEPIAAMGTPAESLSYQSPERTVRGPVDVRTDIYSLGATLYAMLAGRPPLQGSTVDDLIDKIRNVAPERLDALGVHAPLRLQSLILRMLAKKPEDRLATAREVLAQLETLAKEENVTY